jgi:serine/threonine protein kinase
VRIGLSLADALAHLHKHRLVHRDVKPSNIIFVGGAPKLADIGLVADLGEARSFVGTEGFIPPEGPGTPRADLYSLGKVLYELSTGKDRHDFPELPENLRDLPDQDALIELNAVLVKACTTDPRLGYQSDQELQADLALLQRGKSIKLKRTRERRWAVGKRLAVVAGALVLLFALVQQLVIWRATKTVLHAASNLSQNEEARRLYDLARYHFNRMTGDSFQRALQALDQATTLDPKFIQLCPAVRDLHLVLQDVAARDRRENGRDGRQIDGH